MASVVPPNLGPPWHGDAHLYTTYLVSAVNIEGEDVMFSVSPRDAGPGRCLNTLEHHGFAVRFMMPIPDITSGGGRLIAGPDEEEIE